MRRQFLFASIALILTSCQPDVEIPPDILPPEAMKSILIDAAMVEGALKTNFILGDSAKRVAPVLYDEMYQRHETDAASFRKSMNWYFSHPEILEKIQEEVVEELLIRER